MTSPGWAASAWPREHLLSCSPTGSGDPEPPYAVADAWEPPHELALPLDVCDRVRAAAGRTHAIPSGNGTYYMPDLDPTDETAILDRFQAANRLWWKLDEVDEWFIGVKRYRVGERHPEHQDLHAGAARRKLAGVVQLSDPGDYDGGALVVRNAHVRAADDPRDAGRVPRVDASRG